MGKSWLEEQRDKAVERAEKAEAESASLRAEVDALKRIMADAANLIDQAFYGTATDILRDALKPGALDAALLYRDEKGKE